MDWMICRHHVELARRMMQAVVPEKHLLVASTKRVEALIIEEIAIDSHSDRRERRLLKKAEQLHLESLTLALDAFGESNVQTAKHYGNLGRLYQSMKRFQVCALSLSLSLSLCDFALSL